uniref:Uncharacterized protein n=1 Tax=Rhizophora mucronata TaxID=61149 RepID=A0A2P2R229_RHIMU
MQYKFNEGCKESIERQRRGTQGREEQENFSSQKSRRKIIKEHE